MLVMVASSDRSAGNPNQDPKGPTPLTDKSTLRIRVVVSFAGVAVGMSNKTIGRLLTEFRFGLKVCSTQGQGFGGRPKVISN